MTDQEKLAELIGEEGREIEYKGCVLNCTKSYHKEHWRIRKCDVCGAAWKFVYRPKPPDELIEIAEKLRKKRGLCLQISYQSCTCGLLPELAVCEWTEKRKIGERTHHPVWMHGKGKTIQLAQMACAIEGLERLQQEKEKEDENSLAGR